MRAHRHNRQKADTTGYSLSIGRADFLQRASIRSPKEAAEDAASKIILKVKKARENKSN